MSTETTRKIAQEWFDCVQDNKYEKLDALAAPDANWWLAGLREKIPLAGDLPYVERRKATQELSDGAERRTADLLGMTVQDNVAVLEVFRTLDGHGDKHYQTYAIVKMTVGVDGKITEVREYMDFIALFGYLGVAGL